MKKLSILLVVLISFLSSTSVDINGNRENNNTISNSLLDEKLCFSSEANKSDEIRSFCEELASSILMFSSLYHNRGDLNNSISLLEKYKKIKKSIYGKESIEISKVYSLLSIFYANISKKRGEEYFKKAIAIYKKNENLIKKNKRDISSFYSTFARAYELYRDDFNTTKSLYLKSINSLLEKGSLEEQDRYRLSKIYHLFAKFLIKNGFFSKARGYLEKSMESVDGDRIAQMFHQIEVYKDYYQVCLEEKDFNCSIESLKKAYELSIKFYGEDSRSCCINLQDKLALVYFLAKDYKKAKKSLIDIIKLYESMKKDGADVNITLANIYTRLARTEMKLEEYKSAREHYQKALEIYKFENTHKAKEERVFIGDVYNELGFLFYKMEDYNRSVFYFEKSLDEIVGVIGEDNRDLVELYDSIGLLYLRKLKNYKKANFYLKKSVDLYKRVIGEESIEGATSNYLLGVSYLKLGNKKLAKEYFKRALEIKIGVLTDKKIENLSYKLDLLSFDDYEEIFFFPKKGIETFFENIDVILNTIKKSREKTLDKNRT